MTWVNEAQIKITYVNGYSLIKTFQSWEIPTTNQSQNALKQYYFDYVPYDSTEPSVYVIPVTIPCPETGYIPVPA